MLVNKVEYEKVKKAVFALEDKYGGTYSHSVERTMTTFVIVCLSDDKVAISDLEAYLNYNNIRYSMVKDDQHNIYTIPHRQKLKYDKLENLSKFRGE